MATTASTAQAAGVKTPGKGAYSDPVSVGAMIQKMYPQYANFDAVTLGQRWIDVHTPQAAAGTGTDVLSGPVGTTPTTTTDPNAPDLSGLSKFQTLIQQPKPQPSVKIPQAVGMNQLTQGNQLAQPTNNNGAWVGSDIANMFKAPNLQAKSSDKLGF